MSRLTLTERLSRVFGKKSRRAPVEERRPSPPHNGPTSKFKSHKVTWEQAARFMFELGRLNFWYDLNLYHYQSDVEPFGKINRQAAMFNTDIIEFKNSVLLENANLQSYYNQGDSGDQEFRFSGPRPNVVDVDRYDNLSWPERGSAGSDISPLTMNGRNVTWEEAARLAHAYNDITFSQTGQPVTVPGFGAFTNDNVFDSGLVSFIMQLIYYNSEFYMKYSVYSHGSRFQYSGFPPHTARTPSIHNRPIAHSSRSIGSKEITNMTCKSTFQNSHNSPFKPHVNTMLRICDADYAKHCDNKHIKEVRDAIRNKDYIKDPHLEIRIPRDVRRDKIMFAYVYKLSLFKATSLKVKIEGEGGVADGVARTFIQGCLDEIKMHGFFINIPGSNSYVINPNMTLSRAKELGYMTVTTAKHLEELYTEIGALFAYCVRRSIPTPFQLARTLLAHLLYTADTITPEMHVLYYLMDMDPDTRKNMISIFENPDLVNSLGLEMNGYYNDLVPHNKDITEHNFFEYLYLTAKRKIMHQLHANNKDTYRYWKAFSNGFYIKNDLRQNNVNISELVKMSYGSAVNMKNIDEWIRTIGTPDSKLTTNNNLTDHQKQLYDWFQEILKAKGKDLPIEEMQHITPDINSNSSSGRSPRSMNTKIQEAAFVEFFGALMQFWSSVRSINPDETYKVSFTDDGMFATASTCFYTMRLPSKVKTKQELYKQLIKSLYYSGDLIDLY